MKYFSLRHEYFPRDYLDVQARLIGDVDGSVEALALEVLQVDILAPHLLEEELGELGRLELLRDVEVVGEGLLFILVHIVFGLDSAGAPVGAGFSFTRHFSTLTFGLKVKIFIKLLLLC